MKKITFVLFALIMAVCAYPSNWDRSKEISANDLPSTSKQIITKYFKGLSNVTWCGQWPDNYSANFNNGQKLNFYRDGSLKAAKTENKALPKGILNELSTPIPNYIKSKYNAWDLIKLEVKRSEVQVELEKDGLKAKLKFSKSGNILKEKVKD